MVRPGLLLYGVSPVPEAAHLFRPVMAWRARVALVRNFAEGRSLSYGGEFVTQRASRIAVIPVGYADGYFRQIPSGRACVLVHGTRCAVVGRVTMDMILADVTDVPGVAEGDIATLIGKDGNEEITAVELARWAGTIPWHVLTSVGPRPHLTEVTRTKPDPGQCLPRI
jgi:alanine racemase